MNDPQLQLMLDRDVQAPGMARRQVRAWLTRHDLDVAAIELLELVVSELVTNAIVHAHSAPELTVLLQDGGIRIEVLDGATTPPVARPPGNRSRVGGFGLQFVQAVAHQWGWEPTTAGKRVWAEMLWSA